MGKYLQITINWKLHVYVPFQFCNPYYKHFYLVLRISVLFGKIDYLVLLPYVPLKIFFIHEQGGIFIVTHLLTRGFGFSCLIRRTRRCGGSMAFGEILSQYMYIQTSSKSQLLFIINYKIIKLKYLYKEIFAIFWVTQKLQNHSDLFLYH